jgi:hypothetical protein
LLWQVFSKKIAAGGGVIAGGTVVVAAGLVVAGGTVVVVSRVVASLLALVVVGEFLRRVGAADASIDYSYFPSPMPRLTYRPPPIWKACNSGSSTTPD